MARRATSLGPKPSLFLFFLVFFFVFLFCFFVVFLGGFKGQVRWPERPPHLALNPPYLFLCFLFFLYKKNLVFPLEKGIFCLFSVFLFLSPLAFFGFPLFLFLFPCLSLLLFFLYSFLSLFFAFFWFLVWVSLFILLSSLVFFHERNNIKIFNCKFFSSSIFFVFCLFCFKFLFLIFALS